MFSVSVSGHRTHCFLTVPAGLFLRRTASAWVAGPLLHVGLSVALLEQRRALVCTAWTSGSGLLGLHRTLPPARPPHRLRAQRARFPPRGLTEGIILALRLSFPTGFRSSPDPLSTSSSLSSVSRTRENYSAWSAPPCCGRPTGQTGEEINTLL